MLSKQRTVVERRTEADALPEQDDSGVRDHSRMSLLGPSPSRWELVALVCIVGGFVTGGLLLITAGAPLSHDESLYALRAKAFVTDQPSPPGWAPFRAPGHPALVSPAWIIGQTAPYLRLVVLAFGVVCVAFTWLLGRRLFSPAVGLVGAGLFAFSPNLLSQSTLLHPDVPGTALSLVTLTLFYLSLDHPRRSWLAWLAVGSALAATYVRFGAPIPIGLGLVILSLSRWDVVRARIGWVVSVAGAMVAVMSAVLLLPWPTGSSQAPYFALRELTAAAGHPFSRPFTDFVKYVPQMFGPLLVMVITVGVVLAVAGAISGRLPRNPVVTTLTVAAGTGLALAVALAHGEPRYLLPAFPFLMLGAASGLVGAASGLVGAVTPRIRGVAAAAASGLLVTATAVAGMDVAEAYTVQRLKNNNANIRAIAQDIGAVSEGSCTVVTGYNPQVRWYSGCQTLPYESNGEIPPLEERTHDVPSGSEIYVLTVRKGKHQPSAERLNQYLNGLQDPAIVRGDPDSEGLGDYAEAFRYER